MRFWNKHTINNVAWITDEDGSPMIVENVSSKEACMDLCLANSDCVALNHHFHSSSQTCHLFGPPNALGTSVLTSRAASSTVSSVAVRCDYSYEPKTADGHYSPSPGMK